MFKRTKIIAVVPILIFVFAALALSGCMPMDGGGGEGAEGGSQGGLMAFLPIILLIAVFYFILIRPQNKKNKQVNEMRNAIKRGDYVTTIGGFRGRVLRVKDDDSVSIEVGPDKVKLEVMRWGISKIDESAPMRKSSKAAREEEPEDDLDEEEEKPKRKPKKLTAAPKKEEAPAPEDEDLDEDDAEEEDDE